MWKLARFPPPIWRKNLQDLGVGIKSPKRPMLVVGQKPNGKSQGTLRNVMNMTWPISKRLQRIFAVRLWLNILSVSVISGASTDSARALVAVYPVKVSTNNRYLVDQKNTPFLIMGDCPQSLTVNLSVAQADSYFSNRRAHGFNTMWVNLVCTVYTAGRADGSTYDGILPFTGYLPGGNDLSHYDLSKAKRGVFRALRPDDQPWRPNTTWWFSSTPLRRAGG